ncbi:hypothetical protein BDV95DRAFT_363440 [Massariosphaeria phaeospora]|uniref:RRM domain-containing protein n=1 Tax=Massariosphaeria phaeospora TaxID=100035 RepID=A0A7C8I815_9PLEO|nr:hypothetical protein BDV95DRAFT_363440 [Massariosphaeria phaeospora]
MAEAHPSAAPEVASPAMDTHTPLSPADSEKTIVATQRSTTDKELENFEPTPSPAAPAIFSTDLGRRAKRDPPGPPYSPVLVRGNIVDGVALTASKYRNKYGRQYHCIFAPGIVPSGRFTIHDLWDRHDIHLDSPGYLEEVLRFIMKDNEVRVDNFALEWSEKHRDRVALLAGDMTTIYDRNDPMAIANNVFDEDTLKEWPRVFLWHVAHRCRTVLLEVSQQQQTTAAAVPVSDVGMTDRERLLATEPNPNAVVDNEQATLATTSSTRPQASLPTQDPASAVLPTGLPRGYVQQGPTGYLAPGRLSPQSSNYGPAQAPRGYQPQYGGYAAPGLGPLTASPQMNPPMLRNYRGRSARSTSSSSHNQPSPFSWHENHPMQPAHQPRQFSGPIPAAHSPRYPPPPSLAPHPGMAPPMLHPSTGVPPFPPGPSMMAPQAAGNLMPFPPMMGQGMMQPLDMYGQPSMDPDHQTYFQGPPNVRGTYIGDMTNNMQYTGQYGGPSHRPEQLRRGNQPNRPTALYNPYGAENPDFANVPTTYMGKRNGRNSISNGAGRGRKFSVGANSRPSHNQTNVDRGDHIATHNGNRHTEQPKKKVSYGAVDNTIVNDEVRGCNEKWMAPGNDYITHLWIGEVPLGVSIEEVRGMFAREAGVEAIKVTITENYAFVNFASSQDARTALQIEEPRLGGHPVSIKVPKMYFSQLKPGQDGPVSPYYKTQPRATRVAGAYDSGVLPMQQDQDRTADTAAVRKSVKYSPQDARSSLVPSSQPQNEDTLPPKESPAARRKKQKSPTKIAISTVTSIVTSPVASILTSPAVLEDVAPPVISENVTTPVVSEDVTSSVVSEDVTTAQTIDTTSDLATGAQKIVMKLSPVKKKAEKGTIPIDSGAGAAEIVEEKSSTSKPAEGEHNTIEPIGEEAHTDKKLSDEPVPKGEDRQSEQVIDETETSLQTEPEAIAHDTKDAHALQPVLSQEKVVQPEQATTADASKPQLSSTPSEPEVARPLENGKGTAVDVSTRVPDPSSEELVHNIKENTDKQPLPPVPEEAASDDDNKNDTSFVSAQESQGETVTQSEQPIIAKTDAVPEVVHATSEEVVQTQVTEPVPGSKPTETMTTTPQEEKPAGAATVSADASTETGKKPGLKQTESLHPFAKAKTLSKKERQAKKKEKKKEKEKTKVVVPAPSPTLTEDPISNSKLDSSQHKGPAPTGSVSMVDRAPATDKVGNKASLGLGNAADATTLAGIFKATVNRACTVL